jgi:hypothetical protein
VDSVRCVPNHGRSELTAHVPERVLDNSLALIESVVFTCDKVCGLLPIGEIGTEVTS